MLMPIFIGIRCQMSRRAGHLIRGEYGMEIRTRKIYKKPLSLLRLGNGNQRSLQSRCDF
jgi:hypothetical protein